MPIMEYEDLNTTQRVAYVVFWLMMGKSFSSSQLQELLGMSRAGVWYMMTKISLVMPIYQNDDNFWVGVDKKLEI